MACCQSCKIAQDVGQMPRGATCSPCAASSSSSSSTWPGPSQRFPAGVIVEAECPTLRVARIDVLVTRAWEAGEADLDALTLRVLEQLYPQTPDGQAIDWTKLTIETATCLLELRRRVRARVAYVYAHHDEDVAARRWRDVRGGQ